MLLDELESFSKNSGHAAIDPDAVIACLNQLDELSPMDASFEVEASLDDFRTQHREVFPQKMPAKTAPYPAAQGTLVGCCGGCSASERLHAGGCV